MLRLIARYGDSWNAAWHPSLASLGPSLAEFRAACAEEGRNLSSVDLTVSVPVAFPDLGASGSRGNSLTGSSTQIADALHEFADAGVSHVMVEFWPYTTVALERFAEAVQKFQG
jgi:alkanesulfonate monooxygenase SsuD/methylene tetrahydromethanopterin reductase-like flavin-dependent oxidoreductase (luciferase family)